MDVPEDDISLAAKKTMTFQVTVKHGWKQRWETVQTGMVSLNDALLLAASQESWDAGVFTDDGLLYWTKRHPDLFNSTVIHRR